ncbi:hypothetical protein PT251_06765 [Erysipelothrix rhusiopathiae]|nr:hypothetical protein [Erysipelothrix rhusiopathiae]
MNYLYPKNLKESPTLWLWSLKDIGIIGVLAIISVLILTQFSWSVPLVGTGLYAFLTIRFGDETMMNFINYAACYFIFDAQYNEWRADGIEKERSDL